MLPKNERTRLLIIVQNLPVPFDRRVWLECQALTSAGYRGAVVCPKGKGDPGYEVIDGVENAPLADEGERIIRERIETPNENVSDEEEPGEQR